MYMQGVNNSVKSNHSKTKNTQKNAENKHLENIKINQLYGGNPQEYQEGEHDEEQYEEQDGEEDGEQYEEQNNEDFINEQDGEQNNEEFIDEYIAPYEENKEASPTDYQENNEPEEYIAPNYQDEQDEYFSPYYEEDKEDSPTDYEQNTYDDNQNSYVTTSNTNNSNQNKPPQEVQNNSSPSQTKQDSSQNQSFFSRFFYKQAEPPIITVKEIPKPQEQSPEPEPDIKFEKEEPIQPPAQPQPMQPMQPPQLSKKQKKRQRQELLLLQQQSRQPETQMMQPKQPPQQTRQPDTQITQAKQPPQQGRQPETQITQSTQIHKHPPENPQIQNKSPTVIVKGEELKIQSPPNYIYKKTNPIQPYTSWKIEYDGETGYANLFINGKMYNFKLNENNIPFNGLTHNNGSPDSKTNSNNNQHSEIYPDNNVDINDLAPSNSILVNNNGEIDNNLLEESINKIRREINTIMNYKTDLHNLNSTSQEELISEKLNELPVKNLLNNDNPTPSSQDNDNFMTDVVENVLQNMKNNNISNKETLQPPAQPAQNNDAINPIFYPTNDVFNNILHKQQNNELQSPIILYQNETIGLPELLIKHAIDNNNHTNNKDFPNTPQLKYDIIMTSPQMPSQTNHNLDSPQEKMNKLLYSDMFLSPHPEPQNNELQEFPIIESPHDKIENLLEQITSHKVESPIEQDAEKLFNINIFLEDLKAKKKSKNHKTNKSIQENISAIEKILKNIKTNIKKKNKKITRKNSKIKSVKKNTTKTIKPSTKKNKQITLKKDKIKKVTTNKKSKRVKKEEGLFDNLLSNFT